MSDADLFGVRGAKPPASKLATFVKNASLFLGALLITITLGAFLKAYAGGGANKGSGAFYLQATSAMKPGDVISTETAVWRSAAGKRSGAWKSEKDNIIDVKILNNKKDNKRRTNKKEYNRDS